MHIRHPGRTLVFVNAISSVRRVAAILKALGLPAHALHAQQQQRQRLKVGGRMHDPTWTIFCAYRATLIGMGRRRGITRRSVGPSYLDPLTPCPSAKAVDRFKAQEQAILVATDVAARGLDIKGVRCEPGWCEGRTSGSRTKLNLSAPAPCQVCDPLPAPSLGRHVHPPLRADGSRRGGRREHRARDAPRSAAVGGAHTIAGPHIAHAVLSHGSDCDASGEACVGGGT